MAQISLKTGVLERELPWPHQVRLRSDRGLIFAQDGTGFWAGALDRNKPIWRNEVSAEPFGWAAGEFSVGDGRLVYGLNGGPVICLDANTGREVWRTSIGDLISQGGGQKERPGQASGAIALHGDVVIVTSYPRHVVGLSLQSGRRIWTYVGDNGLAQLYEGRYYVTAGWLDCHTGRLVKRGKRQWPEELEKEDVYTWGGWLTSETHLFAGTTHGYVVAWDRETGKHAWHEMADGAIGQIQSEPLVGANGRLYYVDQNRRLYCFEEVNPTDPVLRAQRTEAQARGLSSGGILAESIGRSSLKTPAPRPKKVAIQKQRAAAKLEKAPKKGRRKAVVVRPRRPKGNRKS